MYMYVVYIYTRMSIRDFLFSALINYSVTYVTIIKYCTGILYFFVEGKQRVEMKLVVYMMSDDKVRLHT